MRGGWGGRCGDRVGEVEVAGYVGGVKVGVGGGDGEGEGGGGEPSLSQGYCYIPEEK